MDSNIYEFNAARVLGEYADFLDGNPNCTLLAISASPVKSIADMTKNAIVKSAERLEYGFGSVAWLGICDVAGVELSGAALLDIVEGMDPIAIICLDQKSTQVLSRLYGVSLGLDSLGVALGRRVISFRDFAGMLGSPLDKQKAWTLLKELHR